MKKSDVETHNTYYCGPQLPAVCVKVDKFGPGAAVVSNKFSCTEEQAQKALEFAFKAAQTRFWEDAQDMAEEVYGKGVKVHGAGRSGGWIVVEGLSDVEGWDAIALGRWAKFRKTVLDEIAFLCDTENIYADIESNEWHKPGAEEYNFIDTKAGTKCIADLKAEAVAAGFGPVVRV